MIIPTLGLIFWLFAPASNQWETETNWSPAGPPGASDSASFLNSTKRDIDLMGAPAVRDLVFNALQPFRLRVKPLAYFTLAGAVQSNRTPEFIIEGSYSGSGGQMIVTQSGSLGQARVIINGFPDGNGGVLDIRGRAGNPRIYVNRGAYLVFDDFADADNSFILAKPEGQGLFGGQIYFLGNSQAKNATIKLFGRYSALQVQDHVDPIILLGRLSGNGSVFVGRNTLVVHDCAGFTGSVNAEIGGGLQCANTSKLSFP